MNSLKDLSLKQQQLIERELDKGERVDWIAIPKPAFFTGSSLGTFLFGIPWTAFAVFWIAAAAGGIWGQGGNNVPFVFKFFPLFGVPFVLVGLGMLSSPFWSYYASKKSFYAITNSRVITFTGGRSMTVRSFKPEQLQETYRVDHANGTGDVISNGLHLQRVQDPHRVEEFINQLAEQYQPNDSHSKMDENDLGFGKSRNW